MAGRHFVVRVYPQFKSEERRQESFTDSERLVDRLVELGVPRMNPVRSFPDAGGVLDAVWTNVDVPPQTLDGFGRGASFYQAA